MKDPVCGMDVDQNSQYHFEYNGNHYYFCSENCLHSFSSNPNTYITQSQSDTDQVMACPGCSDDIPYLEYTCPMHPDVVKATAGTCPECGMGLVPRSATVSETDAEDRAELFLTVPGMGSNHCAGLVTTSIQRLKGIASIGSNIASHRVTVKYDPHQVSSDDIRHAVERAGYEVASVESGAAVSAHEIDAEQQYLQKARHQLWFAAVPTTLIMLLMIPQMFWQPLPGYLLIIALLAFPVVFLNGGRATHISAWRSLTNRTANMDVLISMGSLPPYLIGLIGFVYPMTSFIEMASTIMTFHLLGKYLETRAKGRASQAIKRLLTIGAKTAAVIREGVEKEIPIAELKIDDVMVVRPGAKIPTDGVIIEGVSHLDESIATGESVPVEKQIGDTVIGATINKEGLLKVKATKIGADTFLSQVIRLVEQAQGSKVPIQEFADRVTSMFVPSVILIALTSFIMWLVFADSLRPVLIWGGGFLPWVDASLTPLMAAVLAAVAVLVIACPCALGLATPTAIMVGSGMGAEHGVLIRSGEAIQTLKDIKMVVLDKTGTITEGKPALTNIITVNEFSEFQVLQVAASVEAGSEHPLGQALVQGAKERGLDIPVVEHFKAITARGVEGQVDGMRVYIGSRRLFEELDIALGNLNTALTDLENQGKTAMLVAIEGQAAGIVAVADTVKVDSGSAIAALHELGIQVAMVTGDNERTARYVAEQVGIDEVLAGVLPEGKVEAIRRLQQKYSNSVAMVGDGINDAPALKQANVGIAIGAGADVAIEAADVTLVKGELTKLVEAIRLSRATYRKIVENLFWAWIYNLAAIPIAALGLLHPMIGVIAMTSSSLTVIGNSLLLKKVSISMK